jgi:hypothetical protein
MKQQPKFVDPSLLYTFATEDDQRWFKYYPVLNRRLGYQAGTLLNYLLDQQWYIETRPNVKRRHPHYYRSQRDLAKDLGFTLIAIRKALDLLRDNELIWTECKGWPRRNNFYFNQQRIMDIIVSEPSHSSQDGDRTI